MVVGLGKEKKNKKKTTKHFSLVIICFDCSIQVSGASMDMN